jgi:Putative regulator of cell autolysis
VGFLLEPFVSCREAEDGSVLPDLTAGTPAVWNSYQIGGENLPGFGYATYRLRVINARVGEPLSLRIPTFSTAYRLYVDDRLVSSNGVVGTSKEQFSPEYRPKVVEFTPEASGFSLIVHVANFTYARGGMWYALSLGTPEQIRSMDKTIADKDVFLFGALSVMAVYYLIIFLLRREDKSSLFYVFLCVLFASRTMIYGDYLVYRLLPFISFRAIIDISYITLCWFSICGALMVGILFPEENSKKVLRAGLIFGSLATLAFLLTPISFFTRWVNVVQAFALLFGAYPICTLIVSFLKGKRDAGIILIGGVVVIVCAAHDVLYNNNVILSDMGELVPLSLFILLLLQSFTLSRRFSEAFRSVNTLSQQLLRLDKIKDEFLANTSHELRTPLSGILGITEAMLRGSAGELSGPQKQELATIAGSSRRLANLVNDILDYSKMKNGDIRLSLAPVRLEGPIRSVANVFRQISLSKGCEIITEIPDGLPPAMADENRVVQILYNLVGNAVKFTIEGYVRISASRTGDMLEICVSDTGEGIPEDRLEDIFKSFEQVDTSLTRRHGGTGLGLSIKAARGAAGRRHPGRVRPGTGLRLPFTLPIAAGAPEGNAAGPDMPDLLEAAPSARPAGIINEGGSPSLLLVDDDAVSLQASAAILRTDGYAITAVNSGKAALEAMKEQSGFSLVILDVMMPEMSGYEVCRKLRENQSAFDLPVLMLTARTSTQDIVTGFAAGANDYLPKPFEPEELLARVKTLTLLKESADRAMAAEVGFLQAQIKPHFLFNALNTIASFCSTDPQYARKLITSFAGYLRQCFDFESLDMFVPLEKELELVASYVEIEKARFGEKLTVVLDVDSAPETEVFLLCIQPLVENAIRHGLRKKAGAGTVTISVKQSPGSVSVSVSDDGCGIAPDRLKTLLAPGKKQGIGLWNIDRRLRKLFGSGLTIESEPGKGTTVLFEIPSGR